ncbi:MAG: molybdenum cofactor guanylyltransferase [Sideroxyarcus sp.]|nr:molybdenum cofactor guanylyltransferase [Sideroxyarcus sp.]
MIADCTAIILAGGDSRRMGQDKANLLLGKQSLLQHVATVMQQQFPSIMVSVRQPRPEIDLPQLCDDPAYSGPLAGLAAGLERATTPWVFAVACDMPFITPVLIEYLAQCRNDYQAVVPLVHGYPQPLVAFYARGCLDEVQKLLRGSGKHSLRALLDHLQVCYVDEAQMLAADPQLRSFFDLDTPQDVVQATNQMGEHDSSGDR